MSPEICPVCGEFIPRNSVSCPECGACEDTGWSEEAYDGQPDLPDDSFDYNSFLNEEFGTGSPSKKNRIPLVWVIAAVVVIAVFLLRFFF
ncbi:MAG TPA: hypothetical protein EYQ50_23295 [Verrucomicrobiales bacterium]|jgi:hypothetical protein|nr:hypothetical protein [Verrucomicrobiales bacterium]